MSSIKAPCREIVPIILLFSILILLFEFKASVLEILLFSVVFSIATWSLVGDDPAHAERFGIFVGLWAPTLMGMANHFKPTPE